MAFKPQMSLNFRCSLSLPLGLGLKMCIPVPTWHLQCFRFSGLGYSAWKGSGDGEAGMRLCHCQHWSMAHHCWSLAIWFLGTYHASLIIGCPIGKTSVCFNMGQLTKPQRLWAPLSTAQRSSSVQSPQLVEICVLTARCDLQCPQNWKPDSIRRIHLSGVHATASQVSS